MRAKRVVSVVLAVIMLFSLLHLTVFATEFEDVPDYSYYHDAVYWALAQGITNGTGGTSFSPANQLTRGEVVTFLWRLAGSPMGYQNYASQFSDVSSSSYCFNAVGWAVYHGITNGTGNGLFSPNVTVTNKETITFMYRAVTCNQISAVSTTAGSFPNMNIPTSSWYYNACIWANNQGYLASVPEFSNGFLPDNVTTRALVVYLLWEMKTGSSKVFIDVSAGTGISEVTLDGRTGSHVNGYYTKDGTYAVSCSPSDGFEFEKWTEDGEQIGVHNPSAISASRNRTWVAVGTVAIETMVQNAIDETGNHQVDNNGYNIGGHWCAAFAGWSAYSAGLASGTYTLLSNHNGSWQYFKVGQAYAGNYTNPISYPFQVLRNTSCSQQIAHFCLSGHMYVSRNVYKAYNGSTGYLDWSSATVYSTSFVPRRGDFVFFGWTSSSGYVSHVGIVTGVTKNGTTATITTIEGNTNGSGSGSDYYTTSVVAAHEYTFDMADDSKLYYNNGTLRGYIVGFGRIT